MLNKCSDNSCLCRKAQSTQQVMEDGNKCLTFGASEGLQHPLPQPHLCTCGVGGEPVVISVCLRNNTALISRRGRRSTSWREKDEALSKQSVTDRCSDPPKLGMSFFTFGCHI